MSANRMIASAAERYRLAWLSARRRARRFDDLSDELDERALRHHGMYEQAHQLAVRMERERDRARATVDRVTTLAARRSTALVAMQQQRDDARTALERVAGERDEARAEVVKLGKENDEYEFALREARRSIQLLRAALSGRPLDPEGFDRLRAALTDAEVEERIEKIKASARERVKARPPRFGCPTCRTILRPDRVPGGCADLWHFDNQQAQERIEPEPLCTAIASTGHACQVRGPHVMHQATNGSGGSVSWARTEGEAG